MSDLVNGDVFDKLPERYRIRARQIAARTLEINRLLEPCQPVDIRDAAVRLRGQLRPQPEIEMTEFAAEFKLACADLPVWAVSEATNDFLSGRVENHTGQFMPTCAEFARHARTIILPFLSERAALRQESSRLVERASDDRRREIIALERAQPGHREKIHQLKEQVLRGASRTQPLPFHKAVDPNQQRRLDALKKPRVEPLSKIPSTRAGSTGE